MNTQASEQSWTAQLLGWAESVMLALGYPGLALLIVIEQLIPPIPSTLFLPLAGSLASQGAWSLPGVIIASTVGSLVSAILFYGLGRWLDQSALDRLLDCHGRWLGVDAARFDRMLRQFDRHGPLFVFVGRFVGTVRSLISIPAGMRRMRLAVFLPLTALGSGLWNTLLAGAGMVLGEHWGEFGALIARYEQLSLAVLGLAILGAVLWRVWRRRTKWPAMSG